MNAKGRSPTIWCEVEQSVFQRCTVEDRLRALRGSQLGSRKRGCELKSPDPSAALTATRVDDELAWQATGATGAFIVAVPTASQRGAAPPPVDETKTMGWGVSGEGTGRVSPARDQLPRWVQASGLHLQRQRRVDLLFVAFDQRTHSSDRWPFPKRRHAPRPRA